MTDRQTDTRSGCWSITAWDEEMELLKRCQNGEELLPDFVKCITGGVEKCPDTDRLHFQACLETKYCRFSQVKGWLKKAHIEKARKKQALLKYAMKQETSVGQKSSVENDSFISLPILIESLMRLYMCNDNREPPTGSQSEFQWVLELFILDKGPLGIMYVGILSDPRTYRCWKMTSKVLFQQFTRGVLS